MMTSLDRLLTAAHDIGYACWVGTHIVSKCKVLEVVDICMKTQSICVMNLKCHTHCFSDSFPSLKSLTKRYDRVFILRLVRIHF